MNIYLQNLALIQPRTSLLKFEGGGFSAPVISSPLGGDVDEIGYFQRDKPLWRVQQIFNPTFNNMGGDVSQNDDFQRWRTALKGYTNIQTKLWGTILTK